MTLADGSTLPADGQLAGTPSVMFDAVAVLLSAQGADMLMREAAAIDFARDAFGHLKAIAIDAGGQSAAAEGRCRSRCRHRRRGRHPRFHRCGEDAAVGTRSEGAYARLIRGGQVSACAYSELARTPMGARRAVPEAVCTPFHSQPRRSA